MHLHHIDHASLAGELPSQKCHDTLTPQLTGEPSPGEPATHTGIRFVVRFKTQRGCHPMADLYPVNQHRQCGSSHPDME